MIVKPVPKFAVVTEGFVVKPGPADEPVAFPKTVFAPAFERLKVRAGVVFAVATEVVKSGESAPAVKVVTVPLPPPVDLVSAGAAALNGVERSCVAPAMVTPVMVKETGPTPNDDGTHPCEQLTVKLQVVPAGDKLPFAASCIVNEPAEFSPDG